MTEKQLREAQIISNEIANLENVASNLAQTLGDIDNYRFNLEMTRNSPHFSMSLGSQKYGFKDDLKPLLESLYIRINKDILELKVKFSEL